MAFIKPRHPTLVALVAATGLTAIVASTAGAQISIPLGGPKRERPSPNADQIGAPADVAAAVALRGRAAAMRELDDRYHPVEVLDFVGLVHGERVLVVERDVGYFGAIVGAALGPGGRVVELVAPAAMADAATRTVLSDAIALAPNLTPLAGLPATVRLTPNGFDLILLYRAGDRAAEGELPDARRASTPAADRLFAAVRPGGIVGVVDRPWSADDPNGAAGVERAFLAAGFVLDRAGRVRDGDGRPQPGLADGRDPRPVILRFRKPE